MGIWGNVIGKLIGAEKKEKKTLSFPQTFEKSEQGDWTTIERIAQDNMKAERKNGPTTNVMIATVSNGRNSDVVYAEDADFVVFEIEEGTEISYEMLEKLVAYYWEDKAKSPTQDCIYVGRINDDPQDNVRQKNAVVANYVETQIKQRVAMGKENLIAAQERDLQRHQEAEEQRKLKQDAKFEEDLKRWKTEDKQQKEVRLQNPCLKNELRDIGEDGKVYYNYDGVNMRKWRNFEDSTIKQSL